LYASCAMNSRISAAAFLEMPALVATSDAICDFDNALAILILLRLFGSNTIRGSIKATRKRIAKIKHRFY
jgi:hypothetical protein